MICMPVKEGDKIKIDYEGRLDSGEVFDDSKQHGKPLEFEIGAKQVIRGFEKGVIGMEEGEEKELKILSKDAYGDVRENLMKVVDRKDLPKEHEPQVGMMLQMFLENGQMLPATIKKVEGEKVTIDLNHPLAGKNLIFKVKLIEIKENDGSEASEDDSDDECDDESCDNCKHHH